MAPSTPARSPQLWTSMHRWLGFAAVGAGLAVGGAAWLRLRG